MELIVKQEYKETELGLIPMDWDVRLLGDIAKINMGQSPLSSNYNSNGLGLPLVQGNADINNRKTIIRNYSSQITKTANEGDIIMSVRAPVGEVAKATFNCCIGRGVCSIKYSNEYIFQFLLNFEKSWSKFSTGSTFDSVNSEQVKSLKIPLPPTLEEQKVIATALSDVDELISNLDQLITKKKAIKQGAIQQLLTPPHKGGKRLAGFTGEWVEKKLGDIGYFKNGMNKSAEYFGHGFPFVNLMDIFGIPTITSNKNLELINSNHEEQAMYNLKLGDVLFVRSSVKPSGVGLTSVVLNNLDETVFSGFLIRYRTNEELDTNYKIHCFHQKEFRNKVIAGSSSSANTNINQEALKGLVLTFPKNIEEQKAIAKILSDIDLDLEQLETKKGKYQAIKQGMMQELLTGKTRLV